MAMRPWSPALVKTNPFQILNASLTRDDLATLAPQLEAFVEEADVEVALRYSTDYSAV